MSAGFDNKIPSLDDELIAREEIPAAAEPLSYGLLHPVSIWKRMRTNSSSVVGLGMVLFILFLAIFAPLLAPEKPTAEQRDVSNLPPSWMKQDVSIQEEPEHHYGKAWMGRDVRGQDIMSRVIYGARTSLLVGVAVVTIASLLGVTLGCIAGYAGGFIDAFIMRIVDILLAFPFLILALAMVSIFPQANLIHISVVLGIASWPGIARLMRGQVLATRENDYVKAASALGAGHIAILARHILPNCIAPVIIWFTMGIAGAIMGEASLSFLGLGDPDSLSWGSMINAGLTKSDFPTQWWAAIFPAVALAITVLGFNLLGDGLQDAINPRADN